ncbi:MAG: MBL fold metallo-hydrolase [Alphaproteobacteria bacterium]|nr:MBL fold metallo-hydrolase [Alphaproteobacteria bacterium]
MTSSLSLNTGNLSLTAVVESQEPLLRPAEIFPDWREEHLQSGSPWLAPPFYDAQQGKLVIAVQSFVIRTEGLTVLVDTCVGDRKQRARGEFNDQSWQWLNKLSAAGVAPEDVDLVVCTHLHVDHTGWNTKLSGGRWVPTFPNARYLFSQKEFDYWRSDDGAKALTRTGDYMTDSVLPVIESGQAQLVAPSHSIAPHIRMEEAAGHTPGHSILHLEDGARRAILASDLMHHPLQIENPDWSTRFCENPAKARAARAQFICDHAGSDTLILPSHFPAPTAGKLTREGEGFGFCFCTGW